MILLDYRNESNRVGLIDAKKSRWIEGFDRSGFPALAKALAIAGKKPKAIGVTVRQHASWSTMRAAVAAANALAFAWNVPVCEVPVSGEESDHLLAAEALGAAGMAEAGRWAYPAYGGEPTITAPKQA